MKKVDVKETKKFLKESYEFMMKCEEENNLEMCVVCTPVYVLDGEFAGFEFGFIDNKLCKELITEFTHPVMAVAISYKESLKIKMEIDEILEEYSFTKYIKDGKTYTFEDSADALMFIYECDSKGKSYEEIKQYSINKEEAYNIWIEKREKEFLERIKFVKDKLFKI
ncbi:hypothetical protein [Clostridium perfringens]|uniref:hypothetical protein n=1 Tax=Clostridium perfringens TaxID=1502 RepID=UPI0024BBFF08|nr:hypothetical protein [Clostridium perfringens]